MSEIKCRVCNKQIDKSQAIQIRSRVYVCCDECKQVYESKSSTTKPVNNGRKKLLDYIHQIAPNANMRLVGIQLAQLMKDNPDMTYGGIAYTIRYIHNELGKDISQSPLGLVKYKYDECKKYYAWLNQIKQNIQQWQAEDGVDVVIKKNNEEDVFG